MTKDVEYTWQLRGHELIEAQRKLPFKSMSEDIKPRTTIPTLGQTVTEAAVASACFPSWERLSSPRSMLRYVILLNIDKVIGLQVRRCVLFTLTSAADFLFSWHKAPSQLFYSSSQGIQ